MNCGLISYFDQNLIIPFVTFFNTISSVTKKKKDLIDYFLEIKRLIY